MTNKNEKSLPLELNSAMLQAEGITVNQGLLMEAIAQICSKIPYVQDGKPTSPLNIMDICRVFSLNYVNMHNASRVLMRKGYLLKIKEKPQITEKWYELITKY